MGLFKVDVYWKDKRIREFDLFKKVLLKWCIMKLKLDSRGIEEREKLLVWKIIYYCRGIRVLRRFKKYWSGSSLIRNVGEEVVVREWDIWINDFGGGIVLVLDD